MSEKLEKTLQDALPNALVTRSVDEEGNESYAFEGLTANQEKALELVNIFVARDTLRQSKTAKVWFTIAEADYLDYIYVAEQEGMRLVPVGANRYRAVLA